MSAAAVGQQTQTFQAWLQGWLFNLFLIIGSVAGLLYLVHHLWAAWQWLTAAAASPAPTAAADATTAAAAAPLHPVEKVAQAQWERMKFMGAVVLVVALLWVVLSGGGSGGGLGEDEAEEAALYAQGAAQTFTLPATGLAISYYTRSYIVDQQRPIPLMDCTTWQWAHAVQEAQLGFLDMERLLAMQVQQRQLEALAGPAGPTPRAAQQLEKQQALAASIKARFHAAQRCMLHPDHVVSLVDKGANYESFLARPRFWTLPSPKASKDVVAAVPAADLRVKEVIVAGNGTLYVRVYQVVQPPGAPGYKLLPVLVRVSELVDMAKQWWARFEAKVGRIEGSLHCFCPAYADLVGSGLLLYFDAATREWRVHANTTVIYESGKKVESGLRFDVTRGLDFPASIDADYGPAVQVLRYGETTSVATYDITDLSAPGTSAELNETMRRLDPTYFNVHAAARHDPLAHLVPLKELKGPAAGGVGASVGAGASASRTMIFNPPHGENDNLCLQKCLAVERVALERYAEWNPGASATAAMLGSASANKGKKV